MYISICRMHLNTPLYETAPRAKLVLNHSIVLFAPRLQSTINVHTVVTEVNRASTFDWIRSTLDFCLGGQQREQMVSLSYTAYP